MGDRYKMIPDYKVLSQVRILSEAKDYNHELMNIPAIWKVTRGSGVKIAVIDTGVPEHIDLFPVGGHSVIPGYKTDRQGHATHVAGIIGAIPDNGIGVAGIAPDADDYYIAALDAAGSGTMDGIAAAIRYAVDQWGVDVINMSLGVAAGAQRFKQMEAACNYANEQGCTLFAAAGNEFGSVGQPAIYDSVIAVAAVNSAKEHAAFSNQGDSVDFATGGVDVYSTYLNNSYAKLSGTSMACPALASVAALIISSHKQRGEKLTPAEVKEHLQRIAFDVGPGGWDPVFGHGIPVFQPTDTPDEGTDTPPVKPAPVEPKPVPKKPSKCFLLRASRVQLRRILDGRK
jgi:subtilisin